MLKKIIKKASSTLTGYMSQKHMASETPRPNPGEKNVL